MKFIKYCKESLAELHKVTWPTRNQALKSTVIVLIFTLAAGGLITLVDWGFTRGITEVLFRFF